MGNRIAVALLFSSLALAAVARAECKSAYGQAACGHHCIASAGQVRCAKTPAGACMASGSQVVCWDPPPTLYCMDISLPPAECKASYDKIACGYKCLAAGGDVKCAQAPFGDCTYAFGKIACSEFP